MEEKEIKLKAMKKFQKIIRDKKHKSLKNKSEKNFISLFNNEKISLNYSYIRHKRKNYVNNNILLLVQNKLPNYFRKYISLLILYIMIFINYTIILCEFNNRNLLFKLSEVTLKTNITGTIRILSRSFFERYRPCKIYINDEQQTEINYEYILEHKNNDINVIKINWDIGMDTAEKMFQGCYNITEIDLSKFETSNITDMNNMFSGCTSLISLNLANINTEEVTIMAEMFWGCKNLTSLDLSSFNTSKVTTIENLFLDCKKLEYINFKML